MSNELAEKLMRAESAGAFLSEQNGSAGWQTVAALKSEVDRLVGCDLKLADGLIARIDELAELLGDPVSRAFADAGRARALHFSGRYEDARVLMQSATDTLREARLNSEAAFIQVQQVFTLTQMGRYDEALRTARAARRALSGGEPRDLAQLESNVGTIYYRLDRYKKALQHYDRAYEMFSDSDDFHMRALIDFNRSNIFTEMDRPAEALALLESAAGGFDRAGQSLFAAESRFHIAYLQFLRGSYNLSLANYYLVKDRLADLGSAQSVAWCNQEIAEILLALNAFDEAAENASLARASFTALNMPYESAQALLVHALASMGLRQFEQAQSDLLTTRDVFAANRNHALTALVDTYLAELAIRRQDYTEAAGRASAALRVFSRQGLSIRSAYARLLQARAAYHQGERAKAARIARAAIKKIEGRLAPAVAYQCYNLLGRIARDRGRNSQALESFRRAVEIIEQMRGGIATDEFKATFLQDKIQSYEDAITACLDEGSEPMVEEAFHYVESSKSRALADLLARYARGEDHPSTSGADGETRARLARLVEDLNWYSSHAGLEDEKGDQRSADTADRYRSAAVRCERQIARLFRRLESEGSDFADPRRMRAASILDLRTSLYEGETVIEYFTTGDEVSAFVATRDRVKVIRAFASKQEVEHHLSTLRFQLEKFNYGPEYVDAHFGHLRRATDEHLSRLYQVIFAPLESAVETEQIIVIPHGPLHYVPFHALRGDGEFLVERFEISYAPSASVLKHCRETASNLRAQSSDRGRMIALGVPERGTPSIEDEIRALSKIFPDAVSLTGHEATRDNLLRLAPEARFLHLASHGYFRRDNPMFSFLKLADSRLNFYSLLDIRMNAEMVTLSACHTGVNMIFPGDELHGLMRGFLYAGVPSLVASLWAVSDRSTSELMSEMYTHIRAGATKRAALRQAQLAIKDAYGHPYYWAPFILMGDPN